MKHNFRVFAVGAAGAIFFLVLAGVQLITSFDRIGNNASFRSQTYATMSQIRGIIASLNMAETEHFNFLLGGQESNLRNYQDAARQVETEVTQLRTESGGNARLQQWIAGVDPLIIEQLGDMQQAILARQSGSDSRNSPNPSTVDQKQLMSRIRAAAITFQNEETVLLVQRDQETQDDIRVSFTVSILAATASLVFLAITIYVILVSRVKERTEKLEKAYSRTTFLAEVGRILSTSLDYELSLQQVADRVVPPLADWCLIQVDAAGTKGLYLAAAHVDPSQVTSIRKLGEQYLAQQKNSANAFIFGFENDQSNFLASSTDRFKFIAPDETSLKRLQELHINASIALPISLNGEVLGSLVLVQSVSGRQFAPADLLLAEQLADRAALAISNARLYWQSQQARTNAEQYAARIVRYQQVITALSETQTVEEALKVTVEQGISAFGATAGSVAMLTDHNRVLEIIGATGYPFDLLSQWKRFPADSPTLLADAIRQKQTLWLDSREDAVRLYPNLVETDKTAYAWAAVPLIVQGHVIGGMALSFEDVQSFTLDDKAFIVSLSQKCSQALERTVLYDRLRNEREQLQVTLSSIGDAVLATDAMGNITFINKVAQELTGWTEQEAASSQLPAVFQIINETTRQSVESPFTKVIREGQIVGLANHTLLVRKDGREVPIDDSGAPIRDRNGEINGVVLVFRDITERRSQELELERLLQRTQDLYETCHQIGLGFSPSEVLSAQLTSRYLKHAKQAVLLRFSRNWDEQALPDFEIAAQFSADLPLIGLSDDHRVASSHLMSLFSPTEPLFINDVGSDARLPTQLKAQFLQQGVRSLILNPLNARGACFGALIIYFDTPNPWIDQDYRHIQTFVEQLCVSLDNIRLLDEEKQARHEAEQANLLKLKFLAMISHELRTPLTSIKGFATTLLAKDVSWDAENQKEFIGIINDEANKLTDLIDQLLDVSRLQAGTLRINLEPVKLDTILASALPQLEFLTVQHHLTMGPAAALPAVKADSQRIAQVFVNLVGNAAKYSPAGTAIEVSFAQTATMVRVSVSDQGPGIPIASRAKVFEAFWQLANIGLQEKGIGLGLSICKGLIEAHGGSIWIEDREPPGTTITFTLPIAV